MPEESAIGGKDSRRRMGRKNQRDIGFRDLEVEIGRTGAAETDRDICEDALQSFYEGWVDGARREVVGTVLPTSLTFLLLSLIHHSRQIQVLQPLQQALTATATLGVRVGPHRSPVLNLA